MRALTLFGPFAALLVAGCGGERAASNQAAPPGGAEASSPPPASAEPPPAARVDAPPPAQATSSATIPAPFQGRYDASTAACTQPSDGRLIVSPAELRFHESIGTVRSVVARSGDEVVVEADYQGEGESWRSSRTLRLSDSGRILTVAGDGTSFDRVRCPAGTS